MKKYTTISFFDNLLYHFFNQKLLLYYSKRKIDITLTCLIDNLYTYIIKKRKIDITLTCLIDNPLYHYIPTP